MKLEAILPLWGMVVHTSGTNTIIDLNELGITIKRRAMINEIFEIWIGLRNCKDNE